MALNPQLVVRLTAELPCSFDPDRGVAGLPTDGWDDWSSADLEPLYRLGCDMLGEQRPVDARLVMRAWRALGGVEAMSEDGGEEGAA